jgi:hypothetical protein
MALGMLLSLFFALAAGGSTRIHRHGSSRSSISNHHQVNRLQQMFGSLTGNWTANVTQPHVPQHIEIWQTGAQLYLRTDAWGAHPSTGSVDLSAMTATVQMLGGSAEVAKIENDFSLLAFPGCPKWCWCKFPHCPMLEPAHWKPFPRLVPPPPPLAVPAYSPLAPPFPQTWKLSESTIIHTSNVSGWTDTASAAKYGIVSFDWNNAKAIWLKPNRSESTCEATLVEQARRVKAFRPSSKVLVYRNCMYALQWLESERAVMYDPAYADFFLRNKKTGAIINAQAHEGDQYLWNYSNASAAKYKMDIVVGGPGGVGAPGGIISGIFLDDPGPGTVLHPMQEYISNIEKAAHSAGMTATELQELATATYTMVEALRKKLSSQGKMMWLNGCDNADPFPLLYDSNCTAPYGQCGWWHEPKPGPGCVAFFRERCNDQLYGSVDLGVLRAGSWELSIASLLLLRQERGWLVTDWWQGTSAATPLAWSDDLERDVGVPSEAHCSENAQHPGRFSRTWSGGEVRLDCADLSVVLPGGNSSGALNKFAAGGLVSKIAVTTAKTRLGVATRSRPVLNENQDGQSGPPLKSGGNSSGQKNDVSPGVGFYYPMVGNSTLPDGTSLHDAFRFGAPSLVPITHS